MATQSTHSPHTDAAPRSTDDWVEASRIGTILDDLFGTMLPEMPIENAAR